MPAVRHLAVHLARRHWRATVVLGIGLGLSLVGMAFAAAGRLSPVAGALLQEAIDVAVILNALRAREDHPSALVREHVRWALSRHGTTG